MEESGVWRRMGMLGGQIPTYAHYPASRDIYSKKRGPQCPEAERAFSNSAPGPAQVQAARRIEGWDRYLEEPWG